MLPETMEIGQAIDSPPENRLKWIDNQVFSASFPM